MLPELTPTIYLRKCVIAPWWKFSVESINTPGSLMQSEHHNTEFIQIILLLLLLLLLLLIIIIMWAG